MVDTTHYPGTRGAEGDWPFAHSNLAPAELVEHALRQGNAQLCANGALSAITTPRTGRSPKDKYIVLDDQTRSRVAWGGFNTPISPETAAALHQRIAAYLGSRETYLIDAWAGADPRYRIGVRVVAEYAWHALFARQLFLRTTPGERQSFEPDITVLAAPDFICDPERDGVGSGTAIILDIEHRVVLIAGTRYAGEIKKSIFSYLNFLLPGRNVLPMHCSANAGTDGDVALFFGLSGTGKTTLSADPARKLIGDDEHGWSDHGVFNFEGGCYAKCIHLNHENEPEIYKAISFGAVLENVVLDPLTREPDYDDGSLTENTRAAYSIERIAGAELSGQGGHPQTIVFLAADAFGVLPPIARLTSEQMVYYFLSGYTAKLAGTEAGLGSAPEATFSTCFAAPFLPLAPETCALMLQQLVEKHKVRCFLLNTGWSGGPYGTGARISLPHTRTLVSAMLAGDLDDTPTTTDPIFGLHVPTHVTGVPDSLLQPRTTWADSAAYDQAASALATRFRVNAQRFATLPAAIIASGPRDPAL